MGADRNTITTSSALTTSMTQKLLNRSLTNDTTAVPTKAGNPSSADTSSLILFLFSLHRARPHLGAAAHEREVLPEGMAVEGLGQHQLHQVRVTLEHHAE